MFYKKPLLFFIFFIISLRASAVVFTVTSNADSGPGTLRDALTQAAANGTATMDYIYFNLPDTSQAGRTILVITELPLVSSNLTIDASTQPGSKFGVSDAKVEIQAVLLNFTPLATPRYSNFGAAFILDGVSNVGFYGLYITNFQDIPDLNNPIEGAVSEAFLLLNDSNIAIGAPGKGNVLVGDDYGIYSFLANAPNSKITLQSNFIGLMPDGKSVIPGIVEQTGFVLAGNELLVGGNSNNEGNHFAYISDCHIGGDTVQMVNNYCGIDFSGNSVRGGDFFDFGGSNITICKNTSTSFHVKINFASNFNIWGNIDKYFVGSDFSVYIDDGSNGIIGSDTLSHKNVFLCNDELNPIYSYDSQNIQVLKNSIICSPVAYTIFDDINNYKNIPKIKVLVNDGTEYSGTATPNSDVYIYQDTTDCPVCSPVKFITIAKADVNGKWGITGNFAGIKWVSNTTINLNSSEFTQPYIADNMLNDTLVMPSCGQSNGAIKLDTSESNILNVLSVKWYNLNNVEVGSGYNVKNLPPGIYYAKVYNGNCSAMSPYFQLYDVEPKIFDGGIQITNPFCGKSGSITGLFATTGTSNPAQYQWTDQGGTVVGTNLDVLGLSAGQYLFRLTDSVTKCSITYGPITLSNISGPTIDQSKAAIQSTNCGQSNGSITGVKATGTGTLTYTWLNSQQQTVGTSADLTNQPAGTYKLEVTDESQCGPVYTSDLTIPETNGITMDESAAQTTVASCSNNNGSVTGITVTGATQYQWADAGNKVVGNTVDLQNVASGTYTLTASNGFGCTATSKAYTVGQLPPTKFPAYNATAVPACFQQMDGSVTVSIDALVKSVRWIDASGQNAGSDAVLSNAGAGTYQLYLTDQNGCENYYNTYTIAELPEYQVLSSGAVTNDQCNLGLGSISAADIEGGLPPYTYTWYNSSNQQIGTGPAISNLTAGTYTLNVISSRCGESNTLYTVANETTDIAAPSVSNVALCSSGNAIITVNNPSSSTVYRLYANTTDTQPLAEQKGGTFVVSVTGNTSYYVSQLNGSCESSRAEVKVTVGLSALNIANTFTPNGDGINDFWVINGIANYPAAEVQVFTRNGQRIFDSKGYATPFDGKFNGKDLPEGVYYYIIDLHSNCRLLSGSLTIIR